MVTFRNGRTSKSTLKSFTSKIKGVIIKSVNKKKFVACALASITLAATISGGYSAFAFADGAESGYPLDFEDTLTFGGEVVDYAVNGVNMAFATGTKIELLYRDDTGDMKHSVYTHNSQITRLEYQDGRLFFNTPAGTVYEYHPDATENSHKTTVSDFTDFQKITYVAEAGENAYYSLLKDGTLTYVDDGTPNAVEGNFRLLKEYDGKLFVLSGNVPYELDGAKATPRDMTFTDFSAANKIPVGTIAASLKNPAYTVRTASLNENAYYTKIDADLSGAYFKQIQTQKAVNGNIPCLLLYSGDDAAVFATDEGLFITSKDNLTETGYTPRDEEGLVGKTYYALDDVHVYASPFISECTKCTKTVDNEEKEIILKKGSQNAVKVTEVFQLSYIEKVFYRVEYTSESGEKVSGFVPKDMLTPYSFASDDLEINNGGDDPDKYDYGNNVTSVLLAIIIVALVIVAVLYLSLIHGKDDKKKKRKKEKSPPPPPEENDPDLGSE